MHEVSVRGRLPRDLVLFGALFIVWVTLTFVRTYGWGVDSGAYWAAWDGALYEQPPGYRDAYLYSPAFAQAIWPLTLLPRSPFIWLVAVAAVATLWWLVRPVGWRWSLVLLLGCSFEFATGNINWLYALVAAYGLRWPALWVIPALTKITPCVGPLWFLVRGEWRSFLVSVCTIGLVGGVSVLAAPDLWREWAGFLTDHGGQTRGSLGGTLMPPPANRIPVALVLVAIGARRGLVQVIPVAMILASPVFGIGSIVILAALPRLMKEQETREARRLDQIGGTGTARRDRAVA